MPPAALAVPPVDVPPLDAPPVPPPVPVVEPVDVEVVPVAVELVPVEAVVPAVELVPVEPVPVAVAVGVAVAPGVVEVPEVVPELLEPDPEGLAAAGAAPLGIVTVAGGPGTSYAVGSPPPQPASARVPSRRARRPTRGRSALSATGGRTSGGRMWGSR